MIFTPQNQESINSLRAAALLKLDALEKKYAYHLDSSIRDSLSRKVALLREFVKCATDEDSMFSAMRKISQADNEIKTQVQTLFVQGGIVQITGKRSPFSDYLLENEFPASFIPSAFRFRDDVSGFGWNLNVDSGIVVASSKRGEFTAGFMVNGMDGYALLSSEMPEWERSSSRSRMAERQKRIGELGSSATDAFICSIKFSDHSLGISRNSIGPFIASSITGTGELNKIYFQHLQTEYLFCGLHIELNEHGTSLHIDLQPKESEPDSYERRVRAHFIAGKLSIPPIYRQE